jgi:hypothetical protein
MTKDEALDLALEALDSLLYWDNGKPEYDEAREAITAIKQARALDKKAENARELGLDYEPAPKQRWAVFCRFCNKEWSVSYKHPGKSVCVDCDDAPPAQPAPVQQEPVGLIARLKHPEQHYEFTDPKKANAVLMSLCQEAADALAAPTVQRPSFKEWTQDYVRDNIHKLKATPPAQPAPVNLWLYWKINDKSVVTGPFKTDSKDVAYGQDCIDQTQLTVPAAKRQWVGLTEQEAAECWSTSTVRTWQAIEAKLKEKNT